MKLKNDDGAPMPFASDSRGRVLWWLWPDSGSIAADGVALYANAQRIATMLMYPDWVARCGRHLALAVGRDRNSMHGKSIVYDGRDASRDPSRSWISPACDGSTLVASGGATSEGPWGNEHRAIWQLLPTRRQLSHPPSNWSDEDSTLLRDGSILFVRTRLTFHKRSGRWYGRTHGNGTVTPIADVSDRDEGLMYYGHYAWPQRVAFRP